ncbi:hypothetical protein C8J56DRAFT_387654 [Mycena floridula]|nr:hypothetical protein C8J56DRAFT_387654 [Mycena floridula]
MKPSTAVDLTQKVINSIEAEITSCGVALSSFPAALEHHRRTSSTKSLSSYWHRISRAATEKATFADFRARLAMHRGQLTLMLSTLNSIQTQKLGEDLKFSSRQTVVCPTPTVVVFERSLSPYPVSRAPTPNKEIRTIKYGCHSSEKASTVDIVDFERSLSPCPISVSLSSDSSETFTLRKLFARSPTPVNEIRITQDKCHWLEKSNTVDVVVIEPWLIPCPISRCPAQSMRAELHKTSTTRWKKAMWRSSSAHCLPVPYHAVLVQTRTGL